MQFSTSNKMALLQCIKLGVLAPQRGEHSALFYELEADGLISVTDQPFSVSLTYLGIKTLEDWDPILEAVNNRQLLQNPYGLS